MIEVSEQFKEAMKQPVKEVFAYIETEEENITSDGSLISYKIVGEANLCGTLMKQCEISLMGEYEHLKDTQIAIWLGTPVMVELEEPYEDENGEMVYEVENVEYIAQGYFLITETSLSKDKDKTTLKGFDLMIKTCTIYTEVFEYPMSLFDFTKAICKECGLELANDTFINHDLEIGIDYYSNIYQITYRDILTEIAECTCSIAMINDEGQLEFKKPKETGETLTYDNLIDLEVQQKYGPINSVVLSRQPQQDNVFLRDDESIEINGIQEYRIDNNELLDKRREETITSVYEGLKGLELMPFKSSTEGLGWYEVGDIVNIQETKTIFNEDSEVIDVITNTYPTIILGINTTVDGGIKEVFETKAPDETYTDYKKAGGITDRIKNTELVVDKQKGTIEGIVSDMYDENGIINEKFTNVYQDINNIINSIQNSGGTNLLFNSVMFAYNYSNEPDTWITEYDTWEGAYGDETGKINIGTSVEAQRKGSISGHVFSLNGVKVSQKITVTVGEHYSFSNRIKKGYKGTAYVKIYNSKEEYLIELDTFTGPDYDEFVIEDIQAKENYYIVEIYGDKESNATFTDNMFTVGNTIKQWQQANGEIMNTQVIFSVDGVKVKSSIYQGDYTIMSPLEFSGYSNVNGSITRVFTLNKDTTEMKKADITNEIAMGPIKVIPIKESYPTGWAFVKNGGFK